MAAVPRASFARAMLREAARGPLAMDTSSGSSDPWHAAPMTVVMPRAETGVPGRVLGRLNRRSWSRGTAESDRR